MTLFRQTMGLVGLAIAAGSGALIAWAEPAAQAPKSSATESAPETAPIDAATGLKLPKGWPAGHPLPTVQSNCMKCHLHAGRELTLAVKDFSRSVHDLNGFTCHDCHGGNREDDARAHEDEFGFIGTKLSAHLAKCAECHEEPKARLAAGPHHWDFSKRINTKFPMCIDCHGNHDVGNPAADFALKQICQDCHEKLDEEFPSHAAVIAQNDRFWETLRQVRNANAGKDSLVPEEFLAEIDKVRHATMEMVHGMHDLSEPQARALNEQSEHLRQGLEKWLQAAEQAANRP